jgi:hypothetical protein
MRFGTRHLFRLGQLPIQAVLGGLVSAFALGVMPMTLAAVYWIVRTVALVLAEFKGAA